MAPKGDFRAFHGAFCEQGGRHDIGQAVAAARTVVALQKCTHWRPLLRCMHVGHTIALPLHLWHLLLLLLLLLMQLELWHLVRLLQLRICLLRVLRLQGSAWWCAQGGVRACSVRKQTCRPV